MRFVILGSNVTFRRSLGSPFWGRSCDQCGCGLRVPVRGRELRDNSPVAAQDAAHIARRPATVRTVRRSHASTGAHGTTLFHRTRCNSTTAAHADRRPAGAHQSTAPRRQTVAHKTSRPSSRRVGCAPACCVGGGEELPRGTWLFTTALFEIFGNETRNAPSHVPVSTAGGRWRRWLWRGNSFVLSRVQHIS